MRTSDFNYYLPKELIAQSPAETRDSSRLLVYSRETGERIHTVFHDIIKYLRPGDALVINNTRVIPARLIGTKEGGTAVCEILLLKREENDTWQVLAKPGRRLKEGAVVSFGKNELKCSMLDDLGDGVRRVRFSYEGIFEELLEKLGTAPLPPYIHEQLKDKERYQTVYSKYNGSAAAPTAGLHFTKELLAKIEDKGIKIVPVLLHVGLGTFRPVSSENVEEHIMHSEYYEVTEKAADTLNRIRKEGGRIIAVGTTSVRTLETVTDEKGIVHAMSGNTNIFITPGYTFKAVDALVTNFHLPESTLLMLVSAFMGRENVLETYREAVEMKYRFFSFGDAMLIL